MSHNIHCISAVFHIPSPGVVLECKTIHAKDASAHFVAMGKGGTGTIRAVIGIFILKDL
jgi:hypothetical protein